MEVEKSPHIKLQRYIESQKWESARDIAYEMLKSQPESSWLHASLGKILFRIRNLKDAEAHLKAAIFHQESHIAAHITLSQIYLDINRIGAADDHCKKALSLDSTDHNALSLACHIKLAYSDIKDAKDYYETLKRQNADEKILSELHFSIIRHPANKVVIDHDFEIKKINELLEQSPDYYFAHEYLAFLYQKFTSEHQLAEKHINQSLEINIHNTKAQDTALVIYRKKNILLRILTAPAIALSRPDQLTKKEIAIAGLTFIALITTPVIGNGDPRLVRLSILILFTLVFLSFTINLAFRYLAQTEIYHRFGKTSFLPELHRNIHCLSLEKRILTIGCSITLIWAIYAVGIYFLIK